MPRLDRVAVRGRAGLKGRTLDVKLTGADVFAGPNGSGKSTHLLAILAGLRGLATTPTDTTREYLGPGEVDAYVDLVFDGRLASRDLSKTKGKAAIASDALANEIAGPHLVRWDLADFARATDSARAKLLDEVCRVAGATGDWTPDKVRATLVRRLGEGSDAAGTPLAELIAARPLRGPAGDWVNDAIAWAEPAYTTANAAQKHAVTAAEALAAERASAPAIAGDLAEARARIAKLETLAADAKSKLSAARASGRARTDHEARGARLADAVATAEEAKAAAEAGLVEAKRAVDAAVPPIENPAGPAGRAAVEATTAARAAAAADAEQRATLERARVALAAAEARLETLRGLSGQAAGDCRHCGAADPLGLGDAIAAAAAEVEERALDVEDADADAAISSARLAKARAAESAAQAAHVEAREAWGEANRRNADAVVGQARANSALSAATKTYDAAVAELAAWQEIAAPTAVHDTSALDADVAAATAELATAKEHHEAVVRRQELEATFQRAVATREEATARFAQVKALGAALKELRAEIAASVYGPIQEVANGLLLDAGSDLAVEFRDAADYGARRGETFIHFAALSDAERATVGAALSFAFAHLTGAPWVAVILDGLEAIDADHLPGLLRAFTDRVEAGKLDNFVGAYQTSWVVDPDTGAPTLTVPGGEVLNVHPLGHPGLREVA